MNNEMNYLLNWLKENWNNLSDVVSSSFYLDIKDKYLKETNNEVNLVSLNEVNGVLSAFNNLTLFIVEKWLYLQSSVHEEDKKRFYREHYEARTALIYRYFYSKEDGLFYDFDKKENKHVPNYNPIDQFLASWANFTVEKEVAINLLKEIDTNNPMLFVVFMGLRRFGLTKEVNEIGRLIGYQVDDYNPRISTNTCPLLMFNSPTKSLDLILEAGFDTYDYSMGSPHEFFISKHYIESARELRRYADKIGLVCNQTHSIFPVWHKNFNVQEIEKRILYTKRILEISKILGAKNCIVHPINDFDEEHNYIFYQEFLPLAKKLDINIATENMWNWEGDRAALAACSNHNNYKKLLDLVNDDHFVACLDIGHAEMDGLETSAVKMIETLGNYIKCLHIHDNNLHYDRHNLPLIEKIDFELVLSALARINYQGDITFECDYFIIRMPKEMHLSCLKLMYKIGLYFKEELLIRRKAICLKK